MEKRNRKGEDMSVQCVTDIGDDMPIDIGHEVVLTK